MIQKFRAWDKKENQWVDYPIFIDGEGNIYWENYERGLQEADDIIVMQSTGVKDKNGVEIYEGDVLYFEPYETHGNDRVVQYKNGAYRGRLIRDGYSELLAECVYETKVIGNIYENNDLI